MSAEGELMKSPASGQTVELRADKVTLVGGCDPMVGPSLIVVYYEELFYLTGVNSMACMV